MFVELVRRTDLGDYAHSRAFLIRLKEMVEENREFDEEMKDKLFRNMYTSFKQWKDRMDDAKKLVISDLGTKNEKWYFITVGYDDKTITDEKIIKFSTKVAELKYWEGDIYYVNEKYRKNPNGEIYIHHHTHYLVKTNLTKTKVIQYVYQAVKNGISGQNFIDVKTYKDNLGTYEQKKKYIQGDKIESKMECIELDRKWRNEKNIPSNY